MAEQSSKSIPILVWAYTATFTILLFVVLLLFMKNPIPKSEAFYDFNAQRLDQFVKHMDTQTIGVVVFGDSRLRYALEEDEVLAKQIENRIQKDVAVLSITNNWAIYSDFEQLVEKLLESDISLVVVQEELFAKERASSASLLVWRSFVIWRLIGTGPWNPGDIDHKQLQAEKRCSVLRENETIEERKERISRWMTFDPMGENANRLQEMRNKLLGRGVAVPILRVPVSSAASRELPGFAFDDNMNVLVNQEVFLDENFCDTVHMNPVARAAYTRWFVGQVAMVHRRITN